MNSVPLTRLVAGVALGVHLFRKIQLMRFDGKRGVPQGKPVGE